MLCDYVTMEKKQCRLWWPKYYLDEELSIEDESILFGWFLNSSCSNSKSIDVVVAFAIPFCQLSMHFAQVEQLQEVLESINLKMSLQLQESSAFCMIGCCAALKDNMSCVNGSIKENAYDGSLSLGCQIKNQRIEHYKEALTKDGNWIQLVVSMRTLSKGAKWVPEFNHIHLNGRPCLNLFIHLILFDPPTYGGHHFSVDRWGYNKKTVIAFRTPEWFNELHKKPATPYLDVVVHALNCVNIATVIFRKNLNITIPVNNFLGISRLLPFLWYVFAICMASLSAVMYVILQLLDSCVRFGQRTLFSTMLQKIFSRSWKVIYIRSCQFLYWPVFLLGVDSRKQVNVEYAHIAALRSHFLWSSLCVDIAMGIIFGITVLVNINSIHFGILFAAHNVTEYVLRSGCVWLMGVPAGFKLNTELAEVLGTVSLNAIQIFSTIWFFLGFYLKHFIIGLALISVLFGFTVPAAVCIDVLKFASLHIHALHLLSSFIYSRQIQVLASLWRLFRGRKWNPLRQRLDSYDYSVDQHVVGSLLFTPLLLLLPTTSVFYTFFTILYTMVCFICTTIEITISILHATPYAEILLWVARRKRFPSGIWFEIVSSQSGYRSVPEAMISYLHSNYASIAQILAPNYKDIAQRLNAFICGSSPYGILSGQRTPSMLEFQLQPSLPWMKISCKEYWLLCYRSICSGRQTLKLLDWSLQVRLVDWISFLSQSRLVWISFLSQSRLVWIVVAGFWIGAWRSAWLSF